MKRALAGVCALWFAVGGAAGQRPSRDRVRSIRLTQPGGSRGMVEPNVVVDPNEPDRMIVAALSRGKKDARAFYWVSADGGRSWTPGRLRPGERNHDIASDPGLAFGPDCHAYFAHLDFGDFQKASGLKDGVWLAEGGLGVQRSTDCGKTFQPVKVVNNPPGSLQADKDWIVADAYEGSPHRGSLYVFWSFIGSLVEKRDTATDVQFVLSRDGGKTFSPPRQLAKNGYVVQTVVRPNGTLDAIWEERRWYSHKIWHVTSTDGGETFAQPRLVAEVPSEGMLDWPVLAATGKDTLLAAWCQRSSRSPSGRFESRIFYSTFSDRGWSPALALEPDLEPGAFLSYPAVAASDTAVWLLAYRVDATTTSVVLYRAPIESSRFEPHATLATRRFGVKQFCPGWLDCVAEEPEAKPKRKEDDQFSPGDYVGLAGAKGRVVAAYVLPRRDDRHVSRRRSLYVSVVDE